MKRFKTFHTLIIFIGVFIILVSQVGCANMLSPGGGPRDTIPPILVAESPRDSATNVTPKKLTFVFNEYVELQDVPTNVLFSPTPTNTPLIDYKLRTVTVKIRDTLEPNTTYAINFGNAIKDINEGNIFKNFSYVFSTGGHIDSFSLSGKVIVAETGKTDSTLVVVLHRNLDDSAVAKERPRYVAKLDGRGNFTFHNLPPGTFALYAVPNNYGYRYEESGLFAFADKPLTMSANNLSTTLYAYVEVPKVAKSTAPLQVKGAQKPEDKRLRFGTNLQGDDQDLLKPLTLSFNRKVRTFDTTKIALTNADFVPVKNFTILHDTSATLFTIQYNWPANTPFRLVLGKEAFTDSAGNTLAKNDTIAFTTKPATAYGSLKVRFNNLDTSKHPVLLLMQGENIIRSIPLTQRDWLQKLFPPGDYEVRILYDANRNGKWDAGQFFGKHIQPEVVRSIDQKISVKENWDNEVEINLGQKE